MAWFFLLLASLFEAAWPLGLRYCNQSGGLLAYTTFVSTLLLSYAFLELSLVGVSFTVAYAVWSGLGFAGTVLAGYFVAGEPMTVGKSICLLLIMAGVLGMRVSE